MSVGPRKLTNALAGFYGSTFLLNKRIQKHGLPKWAWTTIGITSLICVATAIGTYFVTRDFIAPAIFVGIGYLVAVAVATMADMSRRSR